MEPFTKVVRVGTTPVTAKKNASVYVKVTWNGRRLSFIGVEGPLESGNALGGVGQIEMPRIVNLAHGWTRRAVRQLWATWNRWHLNDMRAGTPRQEVAVREARAEGWMPSQLHSYEDTCDMLQERGLLTDAGHTYGTAWLYEEVPEDVLFRLASMPDADREPAWI